MTLDADGTPHLKKQPAAREPDGLAEFEREIRARMPERHLLDILKHTEHWSGYLLTLLAGAEYDPPASHSSSCSP